ncbi:conserved hypothetical protein [Uncinocarpus reesii 1704]|uniref:Uncharacterized protein n=1 Tax=Uncinocarpus reesii (strain UAMH 1704) TaxID=336963 RepID=C4JZG1_UNCRE|nr:uncharacterized protein UREG_07562 [Uncinocarpus reesii 1704]EEP82697.1 conserved hypothetical protein [Uncinocarpus reesii 1704]
MSLLSFQAARPPPVGSGVFAALAVVSIFCLVLLLLRHYLPLRNTPAYLTLPIFLALALPASVILLVPIDLTSSTAGNSPSGIWFPARVMLVSWRITYWLTFVLTWFVSALLEIFATRALTQTIYNGFHFSSLKSLVMALAYVWGLVLAIYLMGHGLVAIPRGLWRNARPGTKLRRLQSRAPLIYDRLIDAKSNLENIGAQISQLQRRKATVPPDLRDWIEELAEGASFPVSRPSQFVETDTSRSTGPVVITERYLAELTRNLNHAHHKNARFTDAWSRLVQEAADCQAIIDSSTSKHLEFSRLTAHSSFTRRRSFLSPYLRHVLHFHVLPIFHLICSGLFSLASVCIIWSELVKSFAPSISIVGLSVTHVYHGAASVTFLGQVVASGWMLYMCSAAFAGVSDTKVWRNRALVRRNTHGESACWYAGLIARLTVPLAYNFLTLLARDVQHKTSFYGFLGRFIDLTPLGKGFDYFFPILILVPVGATLFNMYGKVKSAFGFGLLEGDDGSADDPSGIGIGTWREGRDLINQELSGPGFLGLSSRSAAGNNSLTESDTSATSVPRRGPTLRSSQAASLPRYEHSTANRGVNVSSLASDDEDDESPFQSFVHRVKNTFETTETPSLQATRNRTTAFVPEFNTLHLHGLLTSACPEGELHLGPRVPSSKTKSMTVALLPAVRASAASYWDSLLSSLPPRLHDSLLDLEATTSQSIAVLSSRVARFAPASAFQLPPFPFDTSFVLAATAFAVLLALLTMAGFRRHNVRRDPFPTGGFRIPTEEELADRFFQGHRKSFLDEIQRTKRFFEDDDREPDVLRLRHHSTSYLLQFPAFAIGDGILTVGDVRRAAGNALDVTKLRRIKLLYKGRLLKNDNATAKSVGLKQNSLIMCVVSEDFGDDDDSTSESEVSEFSPYRQAYAELRERQRSPPRRRRTRSRRKSPRVERRRGDESDSSVHAEPPRRRSQSRRPRPRATSNAPPRREQRPPSPQPAPPPPAPARTTRMPTPSPALNASQNAQEKLRILDDYTDTVLEPLCLQFVKYPSGDQKSREMEHKRLGETAMTQVLLKADGVDVTGDSAARQQRKALINKVQLLLKRVDDAANL